MRAEGKDDRTDRVMAVLPVPPFETDGGSLTGDTSATRLVPWPAGSRHPTTP